MTSGTRALCTAAAAILLAACGPDPSQPPKPGAPRALPTDARPWKGDLECMVERRQIRVLVPYSRTLYFNDRGRERGVTADHVRDFERFVNQKYAKSLGKRPITVYMIPTTRDELLEDVADGLGDIAAGNLTVTSQREKLVDFVAPATQKTVAEVVLTGPNSAPVAAVEDLSGREVHVRKASSYHESLVALNASLEKRGMKPARLALVPDALEDEDLMEMLEAGVVKVIVVDDWKARMWAQVLPKIRVHENVAVRTGGRVGWAIREGTPGLRKVIEEFHAWWAKHHGDRQVRIGQYAGRVKHLQDPTGTAEWKRFEATLELFRKYGSQYGFDPLMLAAQGYQESGLDQKARSRAGAIGVMQLMPATAKPLRVGDIRLIEPNIHGGAKYMNELMTRYFADAKFDEANRSLFAFAAYNAGPTRIEAMRAEARKRRLDPNKWFNHVEVVTAEKVGLQTTTYVRNIYKYYAAYKLMLEVAAEQEAARERLAPGSK
jgi:membrane-bound lytic murein transglycosylase MltF